MDIYYYLVGILQVLRYEFQKFRILEMLSFQPCMKNILTFHTVQFSPAVFKNGPDLDSNFNCFQRALFKETRSVTMNIFRKKNFFLFKSFVKVELSYVLIINMFSTAENCMGK